MTITPQGKISLATVCFENDYKNLLDFPNQTAQLSYFQNVTNVNFTDYTYIKKDNQIVVSANIDSIINSNYLYYQNTGFTNKWYFCFIENMEYVNENATRITFRTDVYQTWLFAFNFKESFIEREHVNNDTIGLHTVPENLETGEYIMIQDYTKNSTPYQTLNYIMAATIDPFSKVNNRFSGVGGNIYNGIYSGFEYFYFDNANDLSNKLSEIDSAGQADAVLSIFMYPDEFFDKSPASVGAAYGYVTSSSTLKGYTLATIMQPSTICENQTYIPKNKKLLTFPYTFLQITNNAGTINNINYEDISEMNSMAEIDMVGIISSGGEIITYLSKAKNFQNNPSTYYTPLILSASKLPVCTWNSDVYINWLTQNGINIAGDVLQTVGNVAGSLLGMQSGNVVTNDMYSILNSASTYYQHSLAPNTVKGQAGNNNPLLLLGQLEPRVYQMSIKKEYAEIIDNFFSMYGYKINLTKMPNLKGRQNWNYVKTINANICGAIPQNDLEILKTIFNNGTTIWHHASTFLDYSQNNPIL